MAMMVIWTAVLLIYGVSTGVAMDPNKPGPSNQNQLKLDMAPNSVDDMYFGCVEEMAKEVKNVYLENEKNKDSRLKEAWAIAETQYNEKWKNAPRVGREQVIAIYVYTFVKGNMYLYFNDAVQTQRPQYKTTFGFHALHFLLTNAIQSINQRRLDQLSEGEESCFTVYRIVNQYFQGAVNTQMRFGSFTSTSLGRYPKANVFGDKTCFEIITCMGADVSMHSKYENEAEVLIPPYEVFKIMEIQNRANQPKLPCEVVYKLKSTEKPTSNLNCALFNK